MSGIVSIFKLNNVNNQIFIVQHAKVFSRNDLMGEVLVTDIPMRTELTTLPV